MFFHFVILWPSHHIFKSCCLFPSFMGVLYYIHVLGQGHAMVYHKTMRNLWKPLTYPCTPSLVPLSWWLHPCIHMGKMCAHVCYIKIINILKPHDVYAQWGPRLVVEGMPSLAWYVCMPSLTSKAGMAGPHPPPPYPINEGHHRVGGAQLCMPRWVAWGGDEGMSLPCVCVCMYVYACKVAEGFLEPINIPTKLGANMWCSLILTCFSWCLPSF